MDWTLAEAAQALQQRGLAVQLHGDPSTRFQRVHTDTRTLQAGDLFVALRGERFDAHDFLPQARAAGAVAVLAETAVDCGLQVADSRVALRVLAAAWRARFVLPLVAVAGSNGKTTVTQMLASVLRAWVGPQAALATAGNFNNDIGLPLTLLRLRPEHRAAVVEIGMNHPGEVAPLAAAAAPTVAVVNNAQREHQEFLASVEATAEENGQVIAALGVDGVAVYPLRDACAPIWERLAGDRERIAFGGEALQATGEWDGQAWALQLHSPAGEAALRLALPGAHNVHNALAATAAALAAGCPLAAVVDGLQAFQAAPGRSVLRAIRWQGGPAQLVDDSYNANPDSMRAAVDLLAGLSGPRWMLMGDMGEVGDQGPAFHAEIGAHAAACGIEQFWCAGALSAHAAQAYGAEAVPAGGRRARHFDTVAQLCAALPQGPAAASLLVKGSRFMRMEQVVAQLASAAKDD